MGKNDVMPVQHEQFVAESLEMQKVVRLIVRASWSDVPVLIQGETGTGKDIIACTIHNSSSRRKSGAPIFINCGAIPEHLWESEMFGYESGAFTGAASKGKPGFFELANRGTLVLDEIGELPVAQQVKLLRAIQNQECYRIGGTEPIRFDARIIAITNRDLTSMMETGQFRQDLYYRLNVLLINVPALRERKADIIPLALTFLEKYNKKYGFKKAFSPDALLLLSSQYWSGNVRELQNVVEKACILCDTFTITSMDLESNLHSNRKSPKVFPDHENRLQTLQEAREQVEIYLIKQALQDFPSIRKAAKVLGVDHATLQRKIERYQINGADHAASEHL